MQRILVVDDDKDILEVLRYILEDSGYVVETLTDGQFLFGKIVEYQPDLILLDIMLGNMDGRELCKQLKNSPATQHIPVILVSASHNIEICNEGEAPNDFIAKPFDIAHLLNSVQKQLVA